MTYATKEQLIERFAEVADLAEGDGDNIVAALSDAEEEVNSYVSVRYGVPLPGVPKPLTIATCDIARFRLYKDRATDEVKYRYERTIKWLESLAKGLVTLTFIPILSPEDTTNLNVAPRPIGAYAPGSAFNDKTLSMIPDMRNTSGW